MSKWLPSLLPVLVLLADQFSAVVQGFLSGHPKVAVLIAAVYAVIMHLIPSPKSS